MKKLSVSIAAVIALTAAGYLLAESVKDLPGTRTLESTKTSQSPNKKKSIEETILARLQAANSEFVYMDVRPSPVAGLYQVQVVNGPMLYVTPEGDKFLTGELYTVEAHGFAKYEDPALVAERKKLYASLKPSDAIIFKPTVKTKAVIYVFTDVDCGYCRKMNNEMTTYTENGKQVPGYSDLGIEVRYLAFPRSGLPSAAAEKLVTAWCSKDKQKALTMLKKDQTVAPAKCANPVASQYELGVKLGVNGTPAVWMPNGELKPGYLPPAQMAKELGIL